MKELVDGGKWCVEHWRVIAFLAGWIVTATITGGMWKGLLALLTLVASWYVYKFGEWMFHRFQSERAAFGLHWFTVPKLLWTFTRAQAEFGKTDTRWQRFCTGQNATWNKKIPPLSQRSYLLDGSVKVLADAGGIGGDVPTLKAKVLAAGRGVMKCQQIAFKDHADPGKVWITFYRQSPLGRILNITELPRALQRKGAQTLEFGLDFLGNVAAIRYGLSVLIGGATEAGKSSIWWAILFSIVRRGEPTELFIVDPKRMELRIFKRLKGRRFGNLIIMDYVNTATEAAALFKRFKTEMHARQESLGEAGKRDVEVCTEQFHARLIAVDEGMDIVDAFKGGGSSDAGIILSQGRGTKDWMVMSVQMAKIATLGDIRDLFPLRICMRTTTPEGTKAILGVGENEGAPCSSINPYTERGVGYFRHENGELVRFRGTYVEDDQREKIIDGTILKQSILAHAVDDGSLVSSRVCSVYVVSGYPRADGKPPRCEYVGKAFNVRNRFEAHRTATDGSDIKWCDEHKQLENFWLVHVDESTAIITPYRNEKAALAAEKKAIEQLMPVFNERDNENNPLANKGRKFKGDRLPWTPRPRTWPTYKPRSRSPVSEATEQIDRHPRVFYANAEGGE